MTSELSFPRRHARSQRFTLGRPRSFTLSPDGRRVVFLRSGGPEDPVHHVWVLDLPAGTQRRLVDAEAVGGAEALTDAERARRERAREGGAGIVAFTTDRDVTRVAVISGGEVWVADVDGGPPVRTSARGPAYDARLSPDGRRVAAVVDGALHVGEVGGELHPLVAESGVTWGVADFVAAEEMRRHRGFWWAPDGERLLVTRVDESAVRPWTIADPADPDRPAVTHRYPAAGTANPDVRLFSVGRDGHRHEVVWDRAAFPYLAAVTWAAGHPALLLVQRRDQQVARVLAVDDDGTTRTLREDRDRAWVEIVPGVPTWAGNALVTVADLPDHGEGGARAVLVDGEPVTPPGLQVRRVLGVERGVVWVTASGRIPGDDGEDPTRVDLVGIALDTGRVERPVPADGVQDGEVAGDVVLTVTTTLSAPPRAQVTLPGGDTVDVAGEALDPGLEPEVELLRLGQRRLAAALLRPAGDGPWPVLLDPYGGPHAQRVLRARNAFLTPAWFAAQGFAVLVVDGRGSPGRGPVWERAVRGDLAAPALEDQIDALHAAAAHEPRLDLARVGIRGWSFGGFLAALACVRRPDVFRAGIAGAPVTDWRLYDTHYTERYLGHPDEHPEAYRRSSVVDADAGLVHAADPGDAGHAELLVIHGLADDNVVAAHSLRLSSALLAAGRPHAFLPLSGVTHMTPQEVVAENLLLVQRDFLRRTLGG